MFFGPNVRLEEIFTKFISKGHVKKEERSGGKGLGGRVPIKSS